MSTEKIYEKFIGWQRQGGGLEYPDSENLMSMLKAYITPEEAEFLTGFPYKWRTLEQVADIKDMDPAELEPKLKELSEKGLLVQSFRREKVAYKLADILFTFLRASLWHGKTDEPIKSTAPWINKYYPELFEQFRYDQDRMLRPLAINETVEQGTTVLPYEDVVKFLDDREYYTVSDCPCRHRYELDPDHQDCTHPKSNCLHFDDLGRYCVETGIGREITREETEAILKEAADSGLVHGIGNMIDGQDTI
jgi:hypothetical protein